MGWFWAESPPKPVKVVAPHPLPTGAAAPPPECPMHKSGTSSPFISSPATDSLSTSAQIGPSTSSCPVKSPAQSSRYPTTPAAPTDATAQSKSSSSWSSALNPLNYMPTFKNERTKDSPQSISLPLDREVSSIPRGDSDANWEYPSPQQMYNAMLRKGYTDTPAEDVESMVAVHNFLNEGAWNEIVQWENIFSKGLSPAWDLCKRGEEGIAAEQARQEYLAALRQDRRRAAGLPAETLSAQDQPKLLRFQGRPNEPTPKAQILQLLAKTFPERFASEPPFDRHDWYVARQRPDGSVREVRYVIDYYGGGLQQTGEPVFYLDIRPALDSPTAAAERLVRLSGDLWWRATGSGIRDQLKAQAQRDKEASSR